MIAKPFFDRFKSSERDNLENNNQPSYEEKLLLKLLRFGLKLENNDSTLLKISRTIFYNLDVNTVCINQVTLNKITPRQIFHNEENVSTTDINWNFNLVNLELINSKKEQYYDGLQKSFSNEPLIEQFAAESLLCIPALDDDGNITVILNIFHHKKKTYSYSENEALKYIAQRVSQFFNFEKTQETQLAQSPHDKTNAELQLRQTTEQLSAASKSLESLSFAVSHELRAPLRSMDSFSKALAEDFSDKLPDEAIDYVSRIRKSCVRMGYMIDDLLCLAKVGRRKIEYQDIDLSRMAEKAAKELIAKEENQNIELKIQSNLHVNADKSLLKIAIQHLLSNAIKYSRLQENPVIELYAEIQHSKRVFAIRDNGSGFDMAYYDQLFEPFKQLHSSSKFDGTGIGLATAERIIERHHGKIWAESDTDEGAVFYFTLPRE